MRALFPKHKPLLLANNYRSTPAIVAASRAIIAPNYAAAGRKAKELVAVRTAGLPVQLVQCATIADEYARIAAEVDAWRAVGVALGKGSTAGVGDGMAVLFAWYEDVAGFVAHMRERWGDAADELLTDCRSKTDKDEEDDEAKGKLLVSTIHSIKGLEYEIVFLAGLGEMTVADDGDDLAFTRAKKPKTWVSHAQWVTGASSEGIGAACEEIRRMLYVAASRPRSLLHVSYAGESAGWCEVVHNLRFSDTPVPLLHLRCGASPGGGSGDAPEEAPPWRTAAQLAAEFPQKWRTAAKLMFAGPLPADADDASPMQH